MEMELYYSIVSSSGINRGKVNWIQPTPRLPCSLITAICDFIVSSNYVCVCFVATNIICLPTSFLINIIQNIKNNRNNLKKSCYYIVPLYIQINIYYSSIYIRIESVENLLFSACAWLEFAKNTKTRIRHPVWVDKANLRLFSLLSSQM